MSCKASSSLSVGWKRDPSDLFSTHETALGVDGSTRAGRLRRRTAGGYGGGGKVISPVLSMRSSLADSMLHARTIFSSKKQCQIGCQGRWHQRHSLTGCFLTTSINFAMHEVKPVVLQGRYPSRVFVCVPQRPTLRELGSRSW